jgi:hypothetical protein
MAIGALSVVLFAYLTNRNWISEMVLALLQGDYLGGKPGLVAAGYRGLADFGIPFWIFLPYAAYVVYRWAREGLSAPLAALAIAISFLMSPYSRRYDCVLFILPACLLLRDFPRRQWFPGVIALLSVLVIPLVNLSWITPPLLAIGILGKFPMTHNGPPPGRLKIRTNENPPGPAYE